MAAAAHHQTYKVSPGAQASAQQAATDTKDAGGVVAGDKRPVTGARASWRGCVCCCQARGEMHCCHARAAKLTRPALRLAQALCRMTSLRAPR
jgi:hypothetical protein